MFCEFQQKNIWDSVEVRVFDFVRMSILNPTELFLGPVALIVYMLIGSGRDAVLGI